MANIKSLLRKGLFALGIALVVIGILMCINDVSPDQEMTLTLNTLLNNVINGLLLASLGAVLAYLAKNGLSINWTWSD